MSYACEGFLGGYEGEVRTISTSAQPGFRLPRSGWTGRFRCTSIRANFHQEYLPDSFWDVWQNRFDKFRDREWARKGSAPIARCGASVWAAVCTCTTTRSIDVLLTTSDCNSRKHNRRETV